MSSFTKALGWGFGLMFAFLLTCVVSCSVISVVGYRGLKEVNQRIEAELEKS